jgi:hypothetical protein
MVYTIAKCGYIALLGVCVIACVPTQPATPYESALAGITGIAEKDFPVGSKVTASQELLLVLSSNTQKTIEFLDYKSDWFKTTSYARSDLAPRYDPSYLVLATLQVLKRHFPQIKLVDGPTPSEIGAKTKIGILDVKLEGPASSGTTQHVDVALFVLNGRGLPKAIIRAHAHRDVGFPANPNFRLLIDQVMADFDRQLVSVLR